MRIKNVLSLMATVTLLFCTACTEADPIQTSSSTSTPTSAPVSNSFKHIGEPVEIRTIEGATMEYTVEKVQIFDHYTDAGITKDKCIFGLKDTPFILIDIKIKKLDGPKWTEGGFDDNVNAFTLTSQKQIQAGTSAMISEMCYFSGQYSGHSKENEKDYTKFWLELGEEKVFQLGWCLHDGTEIGPKDKNACLLTEREGLLLEMADNSHIYVDLET